MGKMLLNEEQWEKVEANEKLIKWMVNKQFGYDCPDKDDMISEGKIGLAKAIATFDEAKNIKFATYASRCIMNEILMYLRRRKKHDGTISIYQPLNIDVDGNELTVADIAEDPKSDFTSIILDKELSVQMIYYLLNYLNPQSSCIMIYHIEGKTQAEIGEIFKISQSYVSRIINWSTKKIKEAIEIDLRCEEKFEVESKGNGYSISFMAKTSKELEEFHVEFFKKLAYDLSIPNFKLICKNERCTIWLEKLSFDFLAKIIREIDTFGITIVSKESKCKGIYTIAKDN